MVRFTGNCSEKYVYTVCCYFVTWVPFNESWVVRDILHNKEQQAFARSLYYITKALDKTRLVSTNDGWEMVTSDICGIHDYVGDGGKLYDKYLNKDELLAWSE